MHTKTDKGLKGVNARGPGALALQRCCSVFLHGFSRESVVLMLSKHTAVVLAVMSGALGAR